MSTISKRMLGSLLIAFTLLFTISNAAHSDFWKELRRVLGTRVSGVKDTSATASAPARIPAPLAQLTRAITGFTQEEEIAIGRQASGNILGAAPLVADTALQLYVNRVGRWVANQSERADLNWRFGVIESNDLNAFAAPGGFVFITRGLYMTLRNESELAGVLAHEIGHVLKKHQLKILQQDQLLNMGEQILTRNAGENPYIKKMLGSGAEIFSRSLDKNAEFEADRIAVILAARAGYDPFGLPAVLQDIGHAAANDDRVALLFATHPHPYDRVSALGEAVGDRLDGVTGQTLENRFYRLLP